MLKVSLKRPGPSYHPRAQTKPLPVLLLCVEANVDRSARHALIPNKCQIVLQASTVYLGLLWAAALLYVHAEGRMLASQQQGTKLPPLPLPTLTSSKDCGIPYALCGGSIPKGIECAKVSSC
jgi:hypothetical protein